MDPHFPALCHASPSRAGSPRLALLRVAGGAAHHNPSFALALAPSVQCAIDRLPPRLFLPGRLPPFDVLWASVREIERSRRRHIERGSGSVLRFPADWIRILIRRNCADGDDVRAGSGNPDPTLRRTRRRAAKDVRGARAVLGSGNGPKAASGRISVARGVKGGKGKERQGTNKTIHSEGISIVVDKAGNIDESRKPSIPSPDPAAEAAGEVEGVREQPHSVAIPKPSEDEARGRGGNGGGRTRGEEDGARE
mmetsp:Transcript_25118/g.45529  ORF Transcript_25118/g.45529 Transcript_25118/m.45529 type:complete len:252 (+) Transcript_25118:863-1618(+)